MKVTLYFTFNLATLFYCHGLKDISSFSWNQCHDDSHVQILNIPLDTCVLECVLRTTCVGVQYERMKKSCGILTVQQLEKPLRTCERYTYIERSAMTLVPKSCEPYKQLDNGSCITECVLPENLRLYSTILGRPLVGSRLKVTCDPPLTQTGDQLIRCDEYGQLSSVPVCQIPPETNVALGKSAWQSVTYEAAVASRAVDGNTANNYGSRSCSHTQDEDRPWWIVDLEAVFTIKTVLVYNRMDSCCADKFSNVYIMTSRNDDISNHELTGTLCSHLPGPFTEPVITFNCGPVTQGRYLKIIMDKDGDPLALCEVQVFVDAI